MSTVKNDIFMFLISSANLLASFVLLSMKRLLVSSKKVVRERINLLLMDHPFQQYQEQYLQHLWQNLLLYVVQITV